VSVSPWPTEQPLFALVLVASLALWGAILLSIFGAIYAVFIALALFFVHLLLIVHVRGSGVRLGPAQFPDLDRRVRELSLAAGLADIPAAYVMQSGGALNAFATKFLRSRMIVLFSDLLDACGNDRGARDMVIGHEIGHIRQGHLNWSILIAPGMFVPFLGAAYSRARERTCDRWGAALCGDRSGALRGLAILAAGGVHGPRVDLEAFVAQRRDLDTGWMTIGRWLSTYPTLAERVAALDPELARRAPPVGRGLARAAGILGAGCLVPVLAGGLLIAVAGSKLKSLTEALRPPVPVASSTAAIADSPGDTAATLPVDRLGVEEATRQARADLARLGSAVDAARAASGEYPVDRDALAAYWQAGHRDEAMPRDPFDGAEYGYRLQAGGYRLWSSGPDGSSETADDLVHEVAH
jgi:Zn-dependent protease with chaperone function